MISRTGQQQRRSYPQQIQPLQALDQTKFYKIKSISNGFCLREELKSFKFQEGDKVRVIGGDPADEPLNFLWMVKGHEENSKQKNQKMYRYQIIHGCTNLNLAAKDYECYLTEQRQPYFFSLHPVKRGGYKIKDQDECYLNLDGTLQTTELADKEQNQEFIFECISPERVKQLLGTCFILNKKKLYALDLNTQKESEDQIILAAQNYRMSQRWFFMKVQSEKEQLNVRASIDHYPTDAQRYTVYIRNVVTQLFVSYNKQKKKLVQSSYPEEWYIMQLKDQEGFFTIRHVKQSLCLNYNNDNKLRLDSEVCEWFIPQSRTILQKSYKISGRRTF